MRTNTRNSALLRALPNKDLLFPCPLLVNNSLLPTKVFTSFRIKTVVFRVILICDIVFGLVYKIVIVYHENFIK